MKRDVFTLPLDRLSGFFFHMQVSSRQGVSFLKRVRWALNWVRDPY